MLIEVRGICQHCAEPVSVLILNGEPKDECSACKKAPFTSRKVKGLIYVVKNERQEGVKVGLTTKSIEARIKSLNTTGVPGSFMPVAIFPSERPKADERKVHEKLQRHVIEKEHFNLSPVDAVCKAYRALNNRRPIFYDSDTEETFKLKIEERRIKMALRLRGERSA